MASVAAILIVEDEFLLAMDLEATLQDHGFRVLAPAGSVAEALAALDRQRPDAVTLEMNLNGESSVPVAARLKADGIPFVLLSGYGDRYGRHGAYRDVPLVRKPYDPERLIAMLRALAG